MAKYLIFVSCGQLTDAEKTLGVLIKTVIDGTPGFEAYFAEAVQDVEALGRHVLDGIRRCVGAIVVLHDRGTVLHSDGNEWGHRSSVWVNQEVAILAYRQCFEAKKIPILAFAEPEVRLEGAMTTLIVNPRPLGSPQDVAGVVKSWMSEVQFGGASDDAFITKWSQLSDDARKVVAGLLEEGGYCVKEIAVRHATMILFRMEREHASRAVRESKPQFKTTDLVKLIHNIQSGHELSVHPTWEFQLRRQTAHWLEEHRSKQ